MHWFLTVTNVGGKHMQLHVRGYTYLGIAVVCPLVLIDMRHPLNCQTTAVEYIYMS